MMSSLSIRLTKSDILRGLDAQIIQAEDAPHAIAMLEDYSCGPNLTFREYAYLASHIPSLLGEMSANRHLLLRGQRLSPENIVQTLREARASRPVTSTPSTMDSYLIRAILRGMIGRERDLSLQLPSGERALPPRQHGYVLEALAASSLPLEGDYLPVFDTQSYFKGVELARTVPVPAGENLETGVWKMRAFNVGEIGQIRTDEEALLMSGFPETFLTRRHEFLNEYQGRGGQLMQDATDDGRLLIEIDRLAMSKETI